MKSRCIKHHCKGREQIRNELMTYARNEDVHNGNSIVIEHSWDIFRREFVGCIGDE